MTLSPFKAILALHKQRAQCARFLETHPVAHPKRVAARQKLARLEQEWLQMSGEAIDAVRQAMTAHWTIRFEAAIRLVCTALFAAALPTVVFALDSRELTTSQWVSGLIGFPLIGAFIGWVAAYGVVPLLQGSRQTVLSLLLRAKDQPLMCEYALERIQEHEACRQWRDAVVNAGRELVMLDLDVISQRAYEARQRKAQAQYDAQCRQLHGLEEAPAGA